jgi:tryptophan synthase beta subunit
MNQIETSTRSKSITVPDEMGFYGEFGGAFIPELLRQNVEELDTCFKKYRYEKSFVLEFEKLLADYVGRPTPLYYSSKYSEQYGGRIFFKREDLNHTGAHKINNTIGQILIAKRMGKKEIVAEQLQQFAP